MGMRKLGNYPKPSPRLPGAHQRYPAPVAPVGSGHLASVAMSSVSCAATELMTGGERQEAVALSVWADVAPITLIFATRRPDSGPASRL